MQYDEIDIRHSSVEGINVIQMDGYHRPFPVSKSDEYRRVPIVDLTEEQARELYEKLRAAIADWDAEAVSPA